MSLQGHVKDLMPQTHEGGQAFLGEFQRDAKAFLLSEWECRQCVQELPTTATPSGMIAV